MKLQTEKDQTTTKPFSLLSWLGSLHPAIEWLIRHGALISLGIVLFVLTIRNEKLIEVLETIALMWVAAVILSHLTLVLYTKDDFQSSEARTRVFHSVCLFVAVAFAGFYLTLFGPPS